MKVRDFNPQHHYRDRKIMEIETVEDFHVLPKQDGGFWNCIRAMVEDTVYHHKAVRITWFPRHFVYVVYEVPA